MPVYLGIKNSKAEEIVLIHSSQSKDEAVKIKSDFNDRTINLIQMDPVDYMAISRETEKLLDCYSEYDKIEINITSGTKPWTIALNELSSDLKNAIVIYIDQNCVFYDLRNKKSSVIDNKLDIAEILKYNNQSTESFLNLSSFTEEDLKVMKGIEEMRKFNYDEFNKLTIPGKNLTYKNSLQNKNNGEEILSSGSKVIWDKAFKTVQLQLVNKKGESKSKTFVAPHVFEIVFNSGWFEYKIAQLLSDWKYSEEVWMNVKFPYKGGRAKNEIDIIVNIGNKLMFVECKTQITDQTDIDKFNTAVKNYGGMGCKALFITDAKMKKEAEEKCEDSGIITFSLNKSTIFASPEKL